MKTKKTTNRILALCLSILLILPVFAGAVSFASAAEEAPDVFPMFYVDPDAEFVPGEIMIMLKEAHPEADLAELLPEIEIAEYEDIYASVIEVVGEKNVDEKLLDEIGMTFVITLADETEEGVINALDKLSENRVLISASPNYILKACSTMPNDTYYSDQWALPKISAPETWDNITDSTVRIAVLDTGIFNGHTDLSFNINMSLAYNAYNCCLGDTQDYFKHGTHVTGIIAAEGNNNKGVCGVAWNAEIVPIKIAGPDEPTATSASELRGVIYALAINVKVANISFDLGFSYPMLHALTAFSNNGGIVVLAAGNGDNNNGIPVNLNNVSEYVMYSAISGVIIVAASDQYDISASFSNYGSTTVDIFAPGVGIYSTVHRISYDDPIYGYMNGTSMATPFVTGAVALLMSEYPNLPASVIKDAIIDNADFVYALATKCIAHGRLNVEAALDALDGVTALPPYFTEYSINISSSVTNGTITPSRTSAPANTFVTLTVDPNPGYWMAPNTLAYNGTPIDSTGAGYSGYLYQNCWYFQMPSSSVTITAVFYMIGDIDLDGSVTIADALAVLRYVAGTGTLTASELIAADVDGDGDVDSNDAQYILDYYAGNITVFRIEA